MQKVYCCVIERSYAKKLLEVHPENSNELITKFDTAPAPISIVREISKDDADKLGYYLGVFVNSCESDFKAPECFVFATSGNVHHHAYKDKPETTHVMITMDKNEDKKYYKRILEHILDCIDAEYDNEYEVTMQIRGIKNEE